MATAAQAIERIAEVTGLLPATVFRAARFLREAGGDLWPQGSQGRGREAHVEPSHLVNLVLALSIADPITTAPAAVAAYRALVPSEMHIIRSGPVTNGRRTSQAWTAPVSGATLAPLLRVYGNTLGARLDGFVGAMQRAENQELRRMLRSAGTSLKLTVAHTPGAALTVALREADNFTDRTETEVYLPSQETLALPNSSVPLGVLRRDVTIPFAVFEAMADLWADTVAHRRARAAGRKAA